MRQYKPNFTANKAVQKIRKILQDTTNDMYKEAMDYLLDNIIDTEDYSLIINNAYTDILSKYFVILSGFATELIDFIGDYLSFGVSANLHDELVKILDQTALFTATKFKDLLIVHLTGKLDDGLATLKSIAKEFRNVIFVHVMNRLITVFRYVLFATYASVVETTQKELIVVWAPVLNKHFKHKVCKTRSRLFRAVPFKKIQELYLENKSTFNGKELFEEGYTFLTPHFLCDGMFLARR